MATFVAKVADVRASQALKELRNQLTGVEQDSGLNESQRRQAAQQLVNELYRATGRVKLPGSVEHLKRLLQAGERISHAPAVARTGRCKPEPRSLPSLKHADGRTLQHGPRPCSFACVGPIALHFEGEHSTSFGELPTASFFCIRLVMFTYENGPCRGQ